MAVDLQYARVPSIKLKPVTHLVCLCAPLCRSIKAATAELLDGGHNDSQYRLHSAGPDSAANDSLDM